MIIDVVIALVLLVALLIGYQRGVVQPLFVYLFFLIAMLILLRERQVYTGLMDRYVHANAVLDVFLALILAVVAGFIGGQIGGSIHKMPVVRGVDGFLGIFVNIFFAGLILYLMLSALVVLDNAFAPTVQAGTLTFKQVEAVKKQLASNPLTAALVDSKDIARLESQSKTPSGARLAETPQLSQLQSAYEDFLQPQLASSRLAPIILRIGQKVPIIGHVGPQDLHASSARKAVPTPTPSPTKKP